MTQVKIVDIHNACFDVLLDWQVSHKDFYFITRKNNNKNRLDDGMIFRGNEKYLVLTFWDSSDSREQIYNINFCVDNEEKAYIDISCRDSQERLKHVVEIKKLLEVNGKKFNKFHNKENRWRFEYPKDTYFLDALKRFIMYDKPIIDKYIKEHDECDIVLANKEINNKCLEKIRGYKQYEIDNNKAKKTGSVIVKPSEYIMKFRHNELSNNVVQYLKTKGYKDICVEKNYIDIQATDIDGNKIYYELKTVSDAKYAMREAIGQLLEYNHYNAESNKADKLIIVSEAEGKKIDAEYLKKLRTKYNIPVYYQQFDCNKKVLLDMI